MLAVDTSALVAIGLDEPERVAFLKVIQDTSKALIRTVSVVEAKMTLYGRKGHRAVVILDDLLHLPRFEITAPSVADMDAAYAAFLIFGKGTGHAAELNFGEVSSYALAKVRNLPLLYKGNDFAETDLQSAVPKLSNFDAVP